MTKVFLALGAAAAALTAVPASADHGYRHHSRACAMTRHGHCVRWSNHGYAMSSARHARRMAAYRVGYRFGPTFAYTDVGALPQPFVTRYNLGSRFRYVDQNGYVYVVNPNTYRVVRVIPMP